MQQAWTPRILWAPDKESEDKSFEFSTIKVESHKAKVGFFNEFVIHSDSDSESWSDSESRLSRAKTIIITLLTLIKTKDLYQV